MIGKKYRGRQQDRPDHQSTDHKPQSAVATVPTAAPSVGLNEACLPGFIQFQSAAIPPMTRPKMTTTGQILQTISGVV